MSGVIRPDGSQWERCTQCAEFHRFGEECDKPPEVATMMMEAANRRLAYEIHENTTKWPFWWDSNKDDMLHNWRELV